PRVEGLAQGDDVPGRLGHLLADELQHPVVHPAAGELAAGSARLGNLVLVVREHQVEPAAVDLERRAEELLRHRRALDVPAGPASAPRRVPPRVLAFFVRLPQREVAWILFERVRLLLLDLIRSLAGQAAVGREAPDAEVDVAP